MQTKTLDFSKPAEFPYGIHVEFIYYDETNIEKQAILQFVDNSNPTESTFSPLRTKVEKGETLQKAVRNHLIENYIYDGPYRILRCIPEYQHYSQASEITLDQKDIEFKIKIAIPGNQKNNIKCDGYVQKWLTGTKIIETNIT